MLASKPSRNTISNRNDFQPPLDRSGPIPPAPGQGGWTSFWTRLKAAFPGLRPPLSFQIPCLEKALRYDHVPIYMDKRLGKCSVSMRWALWRGQRSQTHPVRNILVVAPISAIPDWLGEIEQDGLVGMVWKDLTRKNRDFGVNLHLLKESPEDHPVFTLCNKESLFKARGRGTKCELCSASGGSMWEGEEPVICYACKGTGRIKSKNPIPSGPLAELSWDAVIFDESSGLKTPTSQITWIAQNVLSKIPFRAILSGEPAPSSPMDYFEQMRFLYGSFMGHVNFWNWRDENFQQIGYDWEPKPGRLKAMREAVQSRAVILTRKQAGLSNVKTSENRHCELPPKVRKEYDEAEKLFVLGGDQEVTCTLPVQTHLARLAGGFPPDFLQYHSGHKVKIVLELLKGEYANQPIIILFRFNAELVEVSKALTKAGIPSTYLTGDTKLEERRARMDKFRKGGVKVMLAQLKVFKFGIDASVADTMIMYSMSYDPEDISQAMDRIAHPKKQTPLHYIYIVADDTKDEDAIESFAEKNIMSRLFLSNVDAGVKKTVANLMATKQKQRVLSKEGK